MLSLRLAKPAAIADNPISQAMYLLAGPIAFILHKLKITPNQITCMSVIAAMLAAGMLAEGKYNLFAIFWYLSWQADYVDGTMARLSGRTRQSALRIDHYSDLLKITAVFSGIGLFYSDEFIWTVTVVTAAAFLIYAMSNRELYWATRILAESDEWHQQTKVQSKSKANNLLIGAFQSNPVARGAFVTFATINGHTLIIFFFIPLGNFYAQLLLGYLFAMGLINTLLRMRSLHNLPRL